MVEKGQAAPDFSLLDQDGNTIRLSDFKGKIVVVYFYPKDFTSGCTTEACDFRDNYARLTQVNAEVIGISPDDSAKHSKFKNEHELPFILLTDKDHDVMKAYGAWGTKKNYGREYEGVIRSTFIIDTNGNIAELWRKVRVKGHVDKVIEAINQLN